MATLTPITVFTPAYNRAYILPVLYKSLCTQTCQNFEWLIVDDGSTDDTETLVKSWLAENRIALRYIRTENGGKHRAINRGVAEASGELFFIVDSDDYLTNDAVYNIIRSAEPILKDNRFAGISGMRCRQDGSNITVGFNGESIDATALDIRYKHHIMGDMAEVIKTEVMKRFPFPEIEGERFVPEAVVWNRIAKSGLMLRYIPIPIYVCEYLSDGLTAAITRMRAHSPVASTLCYSELAHMPIPIMQKVKASINYWRFWMWPSKTTKPGIGLVWTFFMPIGLLMHVRDSRTIKNK